MTTHPSRPSSRPFGKWILAAAFVAGSGVALHGPTVQTVEACGWGGPSISDLTTFDPDIAGAYYGLYYDPDSHGFSGACDTCSRVDLVAEWVAYLKDIPAKEWDAVLFTATPQDLVAIHEALKKNAPLPKGYESLGKTKDKDRVFGAVMFVELARSIEPFASFDSEDGSGNPHTAVSPMHQLLVDVKNAFKAARDPFLTQRYGFQVLKTLFYQRDWAGAISFYDKNAAVLTGASKEIAGRSHYYLAGALKRTGQLARSNLELSRIVANYPSLAGGAAEDFQPANDSDWKQALALAKTPREKTELWNMVGLKKDGLVAAQEIVKIDPKSNMIGLLLVRELAHAEYGSLGVWGPPDPKDVSAAAKSTAAIEKLATKLATTAGADRPWLMQLIAGHIAAKRGDTATARTLLTAAVTARPGDKAVANQAKASLALALALTWKMDAAGLPSREDEIARTMNDIDAKFGRLPSVTGAVRKTLAAAYIAAGKMVDAEFLHKGVYDPDPMSPAVSSDPKAKSKWNDVAFIKDMIARSQKGTTNFDKFVLKGSYTTPELQQELALRYMFDSDFTSASAQFSAGKATSQKLGTDPFVNHTIDCHDCDHEKFATAKWTHASVIARMAELEKLAKGTGEPAAGAALDLGSALYNMTFYGNARVVAENSHQATRDTAAALKWFKKAFDLSKNRELKARAAFYAAKAEVGQLINATVDADGYPTSSEIPPAKTWFPVVKQFNDTKYYKEVLKECGNFQVWVTTQRKH